MNNDLISREALLESYDVRRVTEYDETGCGMDYKAVPVEAIEAAPPVDAEPVRHGRWIENGPDWVCSYCATEFKDEIEFIKLDYDYYMPHYCPHCGAKMDLEAQNE